MRTIQIPPEVWWHIDPRHNAYWVECDVCFYDGTFDKENNYTQAYALERLKEHNHYPEQINKYIQAIEKELV